MLEGEGEEVDFVPASQAQEVEMDVNVGVDVDVSMSVDLMGYMAVGENGARERQSSGADAAADPGDDFSIVDADEETQLGPTQKSFRSVSHDITALSGSASRTKVRFRRCCTPYVY